MQKQIVEFAVASKDGNITRIGRTGINQPKTHFNGGKSCEEKPKQANR